jgi:hypothetical protein
MAGAEWDPAADDTGFVAEYGESAVDLRHPSPGGRVLDLC